MGSQLSMDDQFLVLINGIIEENLGDENFSVEKLAQKARISRSMLHRKLVKLTGKSATEHIMEIRLDRARELLDNNTGTVSEIAYKVGFNSPSYFHKAFKKRFQVSPGEIKKNIAVNSYQKSENQNLNNSGRSKFSRIKIPAFIMLSVIIIAGCIIYLPAVNKKSSEKSIAILPFENLSTDIENQYFADGIVEDLLTRLSRINDLKVISRTSSEMFRNKGEKTIPEIAGILGVKYILEGSVQRESENVRISVQLIDAQKDNHILSEQYERKLSEVFKVQGEIAGEIVNKLSLILTDQQLTEILKNQTNDMEALNYYQMGRYHQCRCSLEESLASIDYYKKAIQADSNYALAYAGIAEAYRVMYTDGFVEKEKELRDTAYAFALKALEIDKNTAEAHTVLATIYYVIDFDMEAAEDEFRKAIRINSNNSLTYKEYAKFLSIINRSEEAREYMNKALSVDPFSYSIRINSVIMYRTEGEYKKALEENRLCLEIVKDHPYSIINNIFINLRLGNEKAAVEGFKKWGMATKAQVDSAYRLTGLKGLLRLEATTTELWYDRANFYAFLDEKEKAIEMLEIAFEKNELTPWMLYQTELRNMKSDPRFKVIKKKLGLDRY